MANRVVVALTVILLTGCRGGNREQKADQGLVAQIKDSTLIFDGNSLNGWVITNFGPQGPVYVSGGDIILGMGDGCTGITWKGDFPDINYEVSLDAMRVDGNDFFCGLTFPVGPDPCTLIIGGWGGTTVGLSCIDGLDAAENSTTTLMSFDKKRWYHIWLSVTGTGIKAMVDSIMVVDFKTGHNRLSVRPEVELSRPFGIASWNTTSALRNIRVRRTGK
jgi:hypothetical protein